ncbi:Hsp20 family protein [Paraferrimonas sedimenticola]|uniref:Heat-shock protein IbpA n=1 Tax=Paraferrimonas sedimenticola TaxID=375674 RepID=A0AA37RQ50_9GAMM|nr:Hsp20 family protein [Paraferrimonas sedimenticola]GLP95030.1 heat-shock protein IbpA [Paraferrimonas sedimenticola]
MNSIDLTPLYRSSVGFDRFASILDRALTSDVSGSGYPPYNIELIDDDKYSITLAVAGFVRDELDIQVEQGVLKIRGRHKARKDRKFLHQGIANRSFERQFNLADYVEVTGADLSNGLLTITLVKEIPEAMKPKTIAINDDVRVIEHKADDSKAA